MIIRSCATHLDFGIMGAMPQEVDSILSRMRDVKRVEYGSRTYHVGKINSHDVVLVFSRWGKVAAATTLICANLCCGNNRDG